MSPAPRFSTADIAKGAQERKDERLEQEREAERIERDRASAPHITGSEPAATNPGPITAATNPIMPPGPAMPPTDARPVTPTTGSEPDAATVRAQETRAERETDAAIARAATAGTTGTINMTNTDRQLAEDSAAPLFATDAAANFRQRWDSVQAGFVDDPHRAVEDADALVAETMQRLAETFAQERKRLELEFARQPDASGTASSVGTEELRIALRHYRSFFQRLLSV
jgi:hypothetical protein